MAPRRSNEGDVYVRLENIETTMHGQVLPALLDLNTRTRVLETWLWRTVGAIGVLSFMASIAILYIKR